MFLMCGERIVIMVLPARFHLRAAEYVQGEMGQTYLASGERVGLRMWDEEPTEERKSASQREYETVGYVLEGRALLTVGNESYELQKGDSWVVPANIEHCYQIVEHFKAIEATSPPGRSSGLDQSEQDRGRTYRPEDVLA